ncbi:uncharacterized protein [Canis lupus baileyi]|uniref:uncharacterized protein n=1 Tax=Canis lupus baileyi TaxID=143281 RepID=UPI003B975F6F
MTPRHRRPLSQRPLWPRRGCHRRETSSRRRHAGERTDGRAPRDRSAGATARVVARKLPAPASTCQSGPGRGGASATAQDNEYDRASSTASPASCTSGPAAPARAEIKLVAGGRRKGPQGPRGAPACLAAAVTRCRRRGETSRRPGAGRDARGPARGRAPRALSPGAATPSSGRRPPPPIRPLSRPGTVSGTPSPRPASSAPGGRLFYLLCGCRRALLLTGRIPSRCRRCSCHPRRRRELPTPAPSVRTVHSTYLQRAVPPAGGRRSFNTEMFWLRR